MKKSFPENFNEGISLDITTLASGIYIVELNGEYAQKIIKL